MPAVVYDGDINDALMYGTVTAVDLRRRTIRFRPREGGPVVAVARPGRRGLVLIGGLRRAVPDVRVGRPVEVTGVLNVRTHSFVNTYSIIQD